MRLTPTLVVVGNSSDAAVGTPTPENPGQYGTGYFATTSSNNVAMRIAVSGSAEL
jgi:hypothetical protein